MINLNANVNSVIANSNIQNLKSTETPKPTGFDKTIDLIKQQISKVDELQRNADASAVDLLTGKNQDITSVVSSVAKADMSFKLLIGVRNKLIEAYKQTMNMNI
jgi:flagellar hook-basal body complex protein FliE